MGKLTVVELILEKKLGFIRNLDNKEFFESMQPLERITKRIYDIAEDELVTLQSKNYKDKFRLPQVELVFRIFKGSDAFLSASTNTNTKKTDSHLLVLELGEGYYLLLTPYFKKECED